MSKLLSGYTLDYLAELRLWLSNQPKSKNGDFYIHSVRVYIEDEEQATLVFNPADDDNYDVEIPDND